MRQIQRKLHILSWGILFVFLLSLSVLAILLKPLAPRNIVLPEVLFIPFHSTELPKSKEDRYE